jgi:hypothetical protein
LGDGGGDDREQANVESEDDDRPLTMAQAKRGLAKTCGVDPSSIKVTIQG